MKSPSCGACRENLGVRSNWCGGACIPRSGDFPSCCSWLRHNPSQRSEFACAFEHCDMVAATLCGITDPKKVKRSICAAGHKWLWNPEFRWSAARAVSGQGRSSTGRHSRQVGWRIFGLRPELPARSPQNTGLSNLNLNLAYRFPVGAFDAHWDAIGAGCATDDMVNVIGDSTCIIGITPSVNLVPGVCGVVQGSVHPLRTGIEAGLSAVGDIFNAIATRASTDLNRLSAGLEKYRAGQTGLLRMPWDNGDRTVLVNPNLRGITLGWNLQSTAQDELFAAIEGTAFHTRVILDRMAAHGVDIKRVINAGGIPQKNNVLNRVYANVLGRPVLVPSTNVTSLGAAIFAFLAAGTFKTVEEAQAKICPPHRVFEPEKSEQQVYEELYPVFSQLYFALGDPNHGGIGEALPRLIRVAESTRGKAGFGVRG